jgi:hypothetical protein
MGATHLSRFLQAFSATPIGATHLSRFCKHFRRAVIAFFHGKKVIPGVADQRCPSSRRSLLAVVVARWNAACDRWRSTLDPMHPKKPLEILVMEATVTPSKSQALVARAMRMPEDLVVVFEYLDSRGHRTRRVVSPIRFCGRSGDFLGLCLSRQEPRRFSLARCEKIQIAAAADFVMPVQLELIAPLAPATTASTPPSQHRPSLGAPSAMPSRVPRMPSSAPAFPPTATSFPPQAPSVNMGSWHTTLS